MQGMAADVEAIIGAGEPPLRKRKVEGSGCSASAPKEHSYTVCFWSEDDEMTPAEEEEYYRQIRESDGFDVGHFPLLDGGIMPHKCSGSSEDPIDVALYARVGLHCYNIQKGTNLRLMRLEKYNTQVTSLFSYYITLEAVDPADGSLQTFQTCVSDAMCKNKEQLRVETEICRLKPTTPGCREVGGLWDSGAIDDFYKGDMPNWFSGDALTTGDKPQDYYQVSDLAGNDWLHLYCELALYRKLERGECSRRTYQSFMPLEIRQVYVQTREDVKSACSARNAIFYISFKPKGSAVDYKAIVRKTMDGKPGHLILETKYWAG